MRTPCGRAVVIGLVLAGLLSGCAASVARQDSVGVSTAENPEYLAHPFRLVALPMHLAGNILRYGLIEPFYFAMNTMPDAVGLYPDEQKYLRERQADWARAWNENIANYQPQSK